MVCEANAGSHSPLGDRGACSPGEERANLRACANTLSPRPQRVCFFYGRGDPQENMVCEANAGSHLPPEGRGACSPGEERANLRACANTLSPRPNKEQ